MEIDVKINGNGELSKRTYENNLDEILQNSNTIYVFDVDGTLTDFNYDTRTFDRQVEVANSYNNVRPLKTMQRLIDKLDKDKVYVCSRSIFREENESKTRFLVKHFNISPSKIFFVSENIDKLNVFKFIQDETGIDDEHLLVVEDNPFVLNRVLEKTNYSNVHVSHFVE